MIPFQPQSYWILDTKIDYLLETNIPTIVFLKQTIIYCVKKGKAFYGQEPPSGEYTTTECGPIINYLQ